MRLRALVARAVALCVLLLGAEHAAAQVQFTSTPVTSATVGQPYLYEVTTSNSGSGNVNIAAPFGLPPWLTLTRTGNGTATLSGTPTAAGSFDVVLRAQYGVCIRLTFLCPTQTFTITVLEIPNAPPVVVPPGIPDRSVTQNDTFTLDVAAAFSDPDGDPLSFAAVGLPAGFALSGSTITGLTTAATVAGSPYNVSVTASDGRGGSVTDAFVLTAVPPGRADVFLSSLEVTPSPAPVGASVEWTVIVGNNGPSTSGAINVALELAGAAFDFASNACTATQTADRQRLGCTLEPIDNGATRTLKLTGSAPSAGEIYATATAETATLIPIDQNLANNVAVAGLTVADTVVTTPAQTLAVGASAIAAADVNGDGFADLARAARGDQPALLLDIDAPTTLDPELAKPGDARRGLASVPLAFGMAAAGNDVALADFDNDQHMDAVVANGPGAASTVYRGDSTGVMTELAQLGPASRDDRAVAVADLDADGYVDVVLTTPGGTVVYLNQQGASFAQASAATLAGSAGVDVVLTNVAGSALPDVIVVAGNGPTVRHENLGGGSFGQAVVIDANRAAAAASADFDGDGRADLALARAAADASGLPGVRIYLNDGNGGFRAAAPLGAAPTVGLVTGDLDGDGATDVVAIGAGGSHRIFVGDGTGGFMPHPRALVSRGATSGAIGSFGRAKRADLVLAGPEAIHVFFNDGRGNLGLGDTTRPVIELKGAAEVSMEVGSEFADPGATATDDVDGALTPTVTNPVNPTIVGTYTVTYTALDSAGNAAAPVTRAVTVTARAPEGGGGGGAASLPFIALLALLALANTTRRS